MDSIFAKHGIAKYTKTFGTPHAEAQLTHVGPIQRPFTNYDNTLFRILFVLSTSQIFFQIHQITRDVKRKLDLITLTVG